MAKGSVSTHVLDTTTGKPAPGVRVELQRDGKAVGSGVTDADGRIRELGRELESGTYRLIFDTRAYSAEGFFSRVALDVDLAAPHTHIPLLLSRFGVTSYRGS
ncbi:MAG TPA: hydroxyisourate hydrolase [Candidatus Limnocylindrales bacterium]|nr:hydroxyisourate hydrolase [Candidatus Limnocylindrales bacterium]